MTKIPDAEARVGSPESEKERSSRVGVRRMDLIPLVLGRKDGKTGDTSSSTLIRTTTSTVVLDSGSASARDELIKSVRENDILLEKVNVLVTSRADELHTGNDDLFNHALQHVRTEEWSDIKGAGKRKVAINNRYHWIDRYLRLDVLPFPEGGSLALMMHAPKKKELLEPGSQWLSGKIVLLAGYAISSRNDPAVSQALEKINGGKVERSDHSCNGFCSLEDLLVYCDYVIPAYGEMFSVRDR